MEVYVIEWYNESGDRGVFGYWDRPLTEEEQWGVFIDSGDVEDGVCYVHWDMVSMDLQDIPTPVPRDKWPETL